MEIEKSDTWMFLFQLLHLVAESLFNQSSSYLSKQDWEAKFYSSMNTWIEKSRKDFIASTNHVGKNVSVIIDISNFV